MAFPKYDDIPPDFDVLRTLGYRGRYILPGPIDPVRSGQYYRTTTPIEDARIAADLDERERRRLEVWRVYFVQSGLEGPIKIGASSNVKQRLVDLQMGSPQPLKLLAQVRGSKREEREVHRRFAHLRVRGEWFSPAAELIEYISTIPVLP